MSVGDRLARLLFIVPYVVQRDGVTVAELAGRLGVSTQQIEEDLALLSMVGQPPLTPDHLIDLYIEDDVVYAALDQNLTRPLRLTHDEAAALVLGAKLVGDQGGLGPQLEALLARIVAHLAPPERERIEALAAGVVVEGEADACDDAVAAAAARTLRAAIQMHREVDMTYFSAASDREKCYRLCPLALLTHGGSTYLVAQDTAQAGREKLFRCDRVRAVTACDATFVPPAVLDLEKYRTPGLYGGGPLRAQVRFAPRLARQVRERFAAAEIAVAADGALVVTVQTSSPAWLARFVLGFGDDAEVLGPPACRAAALALCARAAACYAAPASGGAAVPASR